MGHFTESSVYTDSLENGIVNKIPSDERRVLVGLYSLSRDAMQTGQPVRRVMEVMSVSL